MDPTAALSEIRELAAARNPDDMDRMADLITGLDEFLSRGGHLPEPWVYL